MNANGSDIPTWTEDDERQLRNDLVAESRGVPVSAASMLPEAPASANLKLTTPHGLEVMWTLRDVDETALAKRVGAFVLARIAAGHAVSGAPRAVQPVMSDGMANSAGNIMGGAYGNANALGNAYADVVQRANASVNGPQGPVCPVHGTAMKPSQFGGHYCTAKIGHDEFGQAVYCNQKIKQQ